MYNYSRFLVREWFDALIGNEFAKLTRRIDSLTRIKLITIPAHLLKSPKQMQKALRHVLYIYIRIRIGYWLWKVSTRERSSAISCWRNVFFFSYAAEKKLCSEIGKGYGERFWKLVVISNTVRDSERLLLIYICSWWRTAGEIFFQHDNYCCFW